MLNWNQAGCLTINLHACIWIKTPHPSSASFCHLNSWEAIKLINDTWKDLDHPRSQLSLALSLPLLWYSTNT